MKALSYVANRLKEPSTWAGLGTALTGAGVYIRPDLWQEIMGVGMTVSGLIAVLLKEPGTDA
jgi:hypothetical protein